MTEFNASLMPLRPHRSAKAGPTRTFAYSLVLLAAASWLAIPWPASGQIVLAPGAVVEDLLPSNGTCAPCVQRQSCSDRSFDCGTPKKCPSRTICGCQVGVAAAEIRAHSFACGTHKGSDGMVRAESRTTGVLFSDFAVSASPLGENSALVGSFVTIDLQWAGLLVGFGGPHATSEHTMLFRVLDRTDGNRVLGAELISQGAERGTFKIMSIKGVPLPVPVPGVEIHRDETSFRVIPLALKRGHSYRAELRLSIRAVGGASVSSSQVDFGQTPQIGFDRVLRWRKVALVVGQDPLEMVDELLGKLEGHTHVYRTGHGEGHNKVPASTSKPELPPD